MLCAQYGNPQSFYGNIQYGVFLLTPYKWGAWEIPGHYQPPLTKKEEKIIEEHRGNAPVPPKINQEDNALVIARMRHDVRMREIANYRPEPKIHKTPKKVRNNDDEDFFILM